MSKKHKNDSIILVIYFIEIFKKFDCSIFQI